MIDATPSLSPGIRGYPPNRRLFRSRETPGVEKCRLPNGRGAPTKDSNGEMTWQAVLSAPTNLVTSAIARRPLVILILFPLSFSISAFVSSTTAFNSDWSPTTAGSPPF
jgi:hypothetical protein